MRNVTAILWGKELQERIFGRERREGALQELSRLRTTWWNSALSLPRMLLKLKTLSVRLSGPVPPDRCPGLFFSTMQENDETDEGK